MDDALKFVGGVAEGVGGMLVHGTKQVATLLPATAVDILGDETRIVHTAKGIFVQADDESRRNLFDAVLRRSPDFIQPETLLEAGTSILEKVLEYIKTQPANELVQGLINCSLELAVTLVDLVSPERLLRTVEKATEAVLRATVSTVGKLPLIKGAVFSNEVNAATLGLICSKGAELSRFIVDLVECAKCYVPNTSLDGVSPKDEARAPENELDFSNVMNRHAAICQLQRLALSIIFIFTGRTSQVNLTDSNETVPIGMTKETMLKSDKNLTETIYVSLEELQATQPMEGDGALGREDGALPGEDFVDGPSMGKGKTAQNATGPTPGMSGQTDRQKEQWIFINGIAGEYHWTRIACEKLAKRYSRDVTGVLNRGDGILWDLVECAGERTGEGDVSAKSQKKLIQRTESSRAAQKLLTKVLEDALNRADGHVVMVAHSQGCLVLRLALEELVTNGRLKVKESMREWLCVFTFGNPSIDWAMDDSSESEDRSEAHCDGHCADRKSACRHLKAHVCHTEHFANSVDFVAQLGVLSAYEHVDRGYDHVFINDKEDWIGHLFGAQYSLDKKDYSPADGQRSWLLNCEKGETIADVQRRLK